MKKVKYFVGKISVLLILLATASCTDDINQINPEDGNQLVDEEF